MTTARALHLRAARNDVRRDPAVNAAVVAMIVLSACLMSSGALVMERLVGAIDALFEQARPPHFLQMHKGDYDADALERFAAGQPEIESWFVEEIIGFGGAALTWQRPGTGEAGDLSNSLIDNLFVTQNTEFDHLIDASGAAPHPAAGEVYVPVAHMQEYDLQTGDLLVVSTSSGPHELRVAGFVRDSQMASSMSSATRFVVAPTDFDALVAAGGGTPEIIVEYRLSEPSLANDLERAYKADSSLPMNGESVTFTLIRTLHAISDGLAAIALMFVAVLLVAIALLNVRFVIQGRLEDEIRQIGAMKAIGIGDREISRLYLARYVVLTVVGCLLGGALALGAVPLLTGSVQVHYAATGFGPRSAGVLALSLAAVALVVIGTCWRVLRRVRKVSVVDALVHGSLLDAEQTARRARRQSRRVRRTSLATAMGGTVNRRLALLDLRADARQWAIVPIVFFLAAVLMALPGHLLATLSGPGIGRYMGMPDADLLVDLPPSDDLEATRTEMAAAMRDDDRLTDVHVFAEVLLEVEGPEGWQTMPVEVGDYSESTLSYTDGGTPGTGEIALSILNANELGVTPGDELMMRVDGEATSAVVSGIYADVTSGGKTAKMAGEDVAVATGYAIFADVADGSDPVALADEYGALFPGTDVLPMDSYREQTMSQLTAALTSAAALAGVFGIGIAALITGMFLQLRLTRERRAMGTLSAIGFSTAEIAAQLRGKTMVGALVGTVLGSAIALALGGPLIGVVLGAAGLGVTSVQLTPNLMLTTAYPVVLAAAGLAAAILATRRLRGADTSSWLRT